MSVILMTTLFYKALILEGGNLMLITIKVSRVIEKLKEDTPGKSTRV